jgi:hypothetical protein
MQRRACHRLNALLDLQIKYRLRATQNHRTGGGNLAIKIDTDEEIPGTIRSANQIIWQLSENPVASGLVFWEDASMMTNLMNQREENAIPGESLRVDTIAVRIARVTQDTLLLQK